MSATPIPHKLNITPIMLAASISFDSEYSIINKERGLVDDVLIKMIALMSRMADMNTIAKILTRVGDISGKVIRQ